MEAVVLAGGFGTRLRQIVPDMPKPMAPVAGRPFLEILLIALVRKGFERVVLSVGYMAERIVTHFGSSFAGLDLIYEVETTPLGTGGAIRRASRHCRGDHYYVFNGDSYLDLEVALIEAQWQMNHSPIIVARALEDTERYGRLETHDGCVTGFIAKGVKGPGLINGGCYLFSAQEMAGIPLNKAFSIELDYFPQQVRVRRFEYFMTRGRFIDIGVPDDYARAQSELAEVSR